MNTRVVVLVPLFAAVTTRAGRVPLEQIGVPPVMGLTFERAVGVMSVEPLDFAEPVAGAPYSADITTEMTQTLADGNRIERRSTSQVARDSHERVWREQQLAAIAGAAAEGSDVRTETLGTREWKGCAPKERTSRSRPGAVGN